MPVLRYDHTVPSLYFSSVEKGSDVCVVERPLCGHLLDVSLQDQITGPDRATTMGVILFGVDTRLRHVLLRDIETKNVPFLKRIFFSLFFFFENPKCWLSLKQNFRFFRDCSSSSRDNSNKPRVKKIRRDSFQSALGVSNMSSPGVPFRKACLRFAADLNLLDAILFEPARAFRSLFPKESPGRIAIRRRIRVFRTSRTFMQNHSQGLVHKRESKERKP
ncbi:hypothetical protein CDAR_235791 [Caerostris darwini]|uniref:Uncharacterized protein n=1 Tax=Caerostris darwini TaxID=1538125 RepID=A0AAV4SV93_9ARAC|nr:hypothetical protein CDAR_235791 [Caerostris darwini]